MKYPRLKAASSVIMTISMLTAASIQAQTYVVDEATVEQDGEDGVIQAGAGFFDDYTDVINTSEIYTLALTSASVLNGKNVTIAGDGKVNVAGTPLGALTINNSGNASTSANITLAGDARIRWQQFANLTLSNAINESAAGSRLTLAGSGSINSSFNGRTFFLSGAQNYTGGLTVDNAKVVLQASSSSLPTGEIRLTNFGGLNLAYGQRTFSGKLVFENGFAYTSGTSTKLYAQGGYEVNEGVVDATLGLSGDGNLVKVGTGTFNLNGSNDYTGTTTVTAGDLVVDGSLTNAGIDVTVGSGGTLSGSGLINRNTFIAGTHNPGNSPGIQTFGADLTYQDGSNVNWELVTNSDVGRGVNFDGVDLVGTADLTVIDTSVINLIFDGVGSEVDWTDTFWDENQSWLFFSVADGSTTGDFSIGTISEDSLGVSLESIRESALFTISEVGDDVYVNYLAIPEPNSALATGLVIMALGCVRRRMRGRA